MNIPSVVRFFEAMSRNPQLQQEFFALAARHGIDLLEGQMSEDELSSMSGGAGAQQESLTAASDTTADFIKMDAVQLESLQKRQGDLTTTLSNMMKKMSDTSSSIAANLK